MNFKVIFGNCSKISGNCSKIFVKFSKNFSKSFENYDSLFYHFDLKEFFYEKISIHYEPSLLILEDVSSLRLKDYFVMNHLMNFLGWSHELFLVNRFYHHHLPHPFSLNLISLRFRIWVTLNLKEIFFILDFLHLMEKVYFYCFAFVYPISKTLLQVWESQAVIYENLNLFLSNLKKSFEIIQALVSLLEILLKLWFDYLQFSSILFTLYAFLLWLLQFILFDQFNFFIFVAIKFR